MPRHLTPVPRYIIGYIELNDCKKRVEHISRWMNGNENGHWTVLCASVRLSDVIKEAAVMIV